MKRFEKKSVVLLLPVKNPHPQEPTILCASWFKAESLARTHSPTARQRRTGS